MTKETSRILPQSLDALWELHNSGMQSLSTPELSSCSTSSDDQSSFSILSPEAHPSPNFDDGSLRKSVYFSSPVSPIHIEFSIVHRPRRLSGGDHRYALPRGPVPIGPRAPPNKPHSLLIPNIHPYFSPRSPRHSRQPHKPRPAALPLSENWDSLGSDAPSIPPYTPMRAPTLPEFPRNSPFGHPSMQTPTTKLRKKKARPLLANITSDAFFPTGDTELVSPQSSRTHSVVGFDFARKEDQLTSTAGVPDGEHAEGEAKKEVVHFSVKREQHKEWLPRLDFPSPITILSPKHLHFHNLHSSYPNRLVRRSSTEALTSLAWTGEFPTSVSSSVYSRPRIGDTFLPTFGIGSPTSRSGWRSTWSLTEEPDDDDEEEKSNMNLGLTSPIAPISSRHRLIQRDDAMGHKRQWTLAMAITNEDISDERLLGELEKVRTRNEMWEWRNNRAFPLSSPPSPLHPAKGQDESPDVPASEDVKHDRRPLRLKPSLPSLSDPALSATWQVARRALLTCRELVRTERHYVSALHALCSNGTQSPPPAMMLTYLPALVLASEDLLARMEANPSAQGVADAFVVEKEKLEAALVGWSGVVGGFFVGAESRTVGRVRSTSGVRGHGVKDTNQGPIRRRVGSWKWKKGKHSILTFGESVPAPIPPLEGDKEPTKERSKPTVRDLAILPTQRAMRYILLYKDLFSHTSSASASQAAVGRAMQAAITIAQNCDRAQGNAAFLLQRA